MASFSRITGLVSGLDTDNLIKDLMKVEQVKVDRVKQQKQYAEWQQEGYREVSSLLVGFQAEYFDLLKPDTNLRSASTFNLFTGSASIGGVASSKVSVSPTVDTSVSSLSISEITQLAKQETWASSTRVKKIAGTVDVAANLATINASIAGGNNQFYLTVDGTKKAITLDGAYADQEALRADMASKINATFGINSTQVVLDGSNGLEVQINGRDAKIESLSPDLLTDLGFTSGAQNYFDINASLATVFGVTDTDIQVTINGVSGFGIKKEDSIRSVMNKINSSAAGVTMNYDSVTGTFKLLNNKSGYVNEITIGAADDSADFLNYFNIAEANKTRGQDAILTVNGTQMTSATNRVRVNGVDVDLKATLSVAEGPLEISISKNTETIKKTIKDFVAKYNEIIEKLSSKLTEKKEYDYRPLTDDEKEAMETEEIEAWEKIAKKGQLRSDPILQRIISEMRKTFVDQVEGMGISASSIGINMSSNYKDSGKVVLDEAKFEEAMQSRPNEVIEFFTKQSSIDYKTTASRSTRYKENGLINRLYDVVRDNIRTTIDDNGSRGHLVEKAGIEGLSSAVTSELSSKILGYNTSISKLLDALSDKEEDYYQQFARLETAMARFQSQSDFIAGNFGG